MKWKKQTKLEYALRTLTPNEPIKLYMKNSQTDKNNEHRSSTLIMCFTQLPAEM